MSTPLVKDVVDGITAVTVTNVGLYNAPAIPTGGIQKLVCRAQVLKSGTSLASDVEAHVLAKNVGGTVTIVSPVAANSEGYVANATAHAPTNPAPVVEIVEDDGAIFFSASVTGTQVKVEANQANTTSRSWCWEVTSYTSVP